MGVDRTFRYMAEQMEVRLKQVAGFVNLLIETATTQTRKFGEFTIPGLGRLMKAQRAARMGRNSVFDHAGNVAIAAAAGAIGYLFSQRAVLLLVPVFALAAAVAMLSIPQSGA